MKLSLLLLSSFMAATLVKCSSPPVNAYSGLIFFASTIFSAINREYGFRIRDLLRAPRMPLLMPDTTSQSPKFNLGDVVVDATGNQFFFIAYYDADKNSSDLICIKEGILHRNILLKNLQVVNEAFPEMQQLYVLPSTKSFFKLINEHEGRILTFSHELKTFLVADRTSLDACLEEFLRAYEATPASPKEESFKSPNSVTWEDELYAIELLPSLFKLQEVSKELTHVRINFIKNALIPYLRQRKPLSNHAIRVLFDSAREIFASAPRIVYINGKVGEHFTVVGDIHGQFKDMLKIFDYRKTPSVSNKYLFNGDIVDRGNQSLACLLVLLAYKITLPDSFFINRGNHESNHCHPDTFYHEMLRLDPTGQLYEEALDMFRFMPSAHVLNETAFIVHGGIPENFDIAAYNADERPPANTLDIREVELLWNDPCEDEGISPNPRRGGSTKQFGPDVTFDFLKRHGLQFIIRSHSLTETGASKNHDDRCYTVFSAPNYCDCVGNEAAYIAITFYPDRMAPIFHHFR